MMGATTLYQLLYKIIRMIRMPTKEGLRKDFESLALRCARKKLHGTANRDDEAILWAAGMLQRLAALAQSERPPRPDSHP